MQGVLCPFHARGSVYLMQEVLSCKRFCHLVQEVLWSKQGSSTVSRKGFYPFHARGSVSGVVLCKRFYVPCKGFWHQKIGISEPTMACHKIQC